MPRQFYPIFTLFLVLLAAGGQLLAQQPPKLPKPSPAGTTAKKPVVKTALGNITGSITLDAAAAAQLVSQPLKITDDQKVSYTISSYQFAYKRIGITEDEQTGKTSPQSDMAAERFTSTPLPAVWQKNIVEGLHKGEELYFFDIIVFDKQGRRFFAPEVKILVK